MENLGLVGFTGAGANRLFSALTGLPVPSEYEAAVGVASLPDVRLERLTEMSKSKKTVAAGFELVLTYWLYTYIPWFFPFAALALLAPALPLRQLVTQEGDRPAPPLGDRAFPEREIPVPGTSY